jgi:hypothetical protein
MGRDYSLGYVRGLADTRGSLHRIGRKRSAQMAITFRAVDESVLDELALHLDVLGYEFKRYQQSPGTKDRTQHMLRIHKQADVRRFCGEVGFRRADRAGRAREFLAHEASQLN